MPYDNSAPEVVELPNPSWAPVVAVLTNGATNPTTIKDGDTLDGVVLGQGDRFLCSGTRVDAGPYEVGAGSSSRAADANAAAEFKAGKTVRCSSGATVENRGTWRHTTSVAITLGTTALTFSKLINEAEDIPTSYGFSNTAPSAVTLGF